MINGQILPDSPFGQLLTKYAAESETIVEVGCWRGEGSTLCLYRGLTRPSQRLYCVELEKELYEIARAKYDDPRVTFLHGRITDSMEDFSHPLGEDARGPMGYDYLKGVFAATPKVLDQLPERIGFLLLDGGEWTSTGELDALIDRTSTVALDDCNFACAHKNVANRERLLQLGWTVLHDDLNDRNGCAVFRKPTRLAD